MKNLINILKIKIVSILEYIHATIHSSTCTCVFVLCPCVCILLIGFLSVAVIYNPLFSHLFQCDLVVQILHCIQQQPQKNIDTYTHRHASTHTHTHTHTRSNHHWKRIHRNDPFAGAWSDQWLSWTDLLTFNPFPSHHTPWKNPSHTRIHTHRHEHALTHTNTLAYENTQIIIHS